MDVFVFEYAKGTAIEQQMGDIAYIEKMCYEFSKLLFNVNTEHNRICNQWNMRYNELEQHCMELEQRCAKLEKYFIDQGTKGSEAQIDSTDMNLSKLSKIKTRRIVVGIWLSGMWRNLKRNIKHIIAPVARILFRVGRRVVSTLGIKEALKRTSIYKRLRNIGIIDKLQ